MHVFFLIWMSYFGQADEVITLTDKTFKEALIKYQKVLVKFYAPWCGHCKELAPHYQKAAEILKENSVPVTLAKLDATKNPRSAQLYDIQGYPTLKYFEEGKTIDYGGKRNTVGIVNWVTKKVSPPVKFLQYKALADIKSSENLAFVLFSEQGSEVVKIFTQVASNKQGMYYYIVSDIQQNQKNSQLRVYKQYNQLDEMFVGDFNENEISIFIQKHHTRWVLPFEQRAIQHVFKNEFPCMFLFVSESQHPEFSQILQKVAKNIRFISPTIDTAKYYFLLTYADISTGINQRLADYLGLDSSQMPFAFIYHPGGANHILHPPLSQVRIFDFIRQWAQGELSSFIKSEPIPLNQNTKGVRNLVGLNYLETVKDRSKDVLVQFYAPWCKHCQKLEPEYQKVARAFEKQEDILIARIDGTKNQILEVPVKDFPTILFYPANNKEGVEFTGKREAGDLIEFIKKYAARQRVDL